MEGDFARGDCVLIRNLQGGEIGRGLVGYDAAPRPKDHRPQFARHRRDVGHRRAAAEMIHRDDMVLGREALI